MQSPVLQAEAQGKILRALLRANSEQLLSKVLGVLQKGFKFYPINVYAAISDSGIINRETVIPELFKADQVTDAIEEKLKILKKSSSILSITSNDVAWSINAEEAKNVAEFLLHQHMPLHKTAIETKPEQPKMGAAKPIKAATNKTIEINFVPKVGAICPKCNQHKLIRKSISRSNGTETAFLACEAYPKDCNAIFALVAVANGASLLTSKIETKKELSANDNCPQCSTGKLVLHKAKTEFLGCSQYPKCKFTSYKNNV